MDETRPAELVLQISVRAVLCVLYGLGILHGFHLIFLSSRKGGVKPGGKFERPDACPKTPDCCLQTNPPEANALDTVVLEKMKELRLDRALSAIRIATHCFGPLFIAGAVWNEVTNQAGMFTMEILTRYLMLMFTYLGGLLLAFDYIELTIRAVDVLYAVVMLGHAFTVLTTDDYEWLLVSSGLRITSRIFVTCIYMDYWKAMPWQIGIALSMAWQGFSSGFGYWLLLALYEVCTCALIVVLCCVFRKWSEAHCHVQAIVENQKAAAFTLLGLQCDAVVRLSHDLRIRGPAQRLSSLLLCGDVPGNLDGNQFERYISTDADKDRFHEFVAQSMATQPHDRPPSSLHIELRDATSTTFLVEVFHVLCLEDGGRCGHLIGIGALDREQRTGHEDAVPIAEVEVQPPRVPSQGPQVDDVDGRRQEVDGAAEDIGDAQEITAREDHEHGAPSVCASSSGEESISRYTGNSFVPIVPEEEAFADTCVILDGLTYELLGCTDSFRSFTGPLLSGASLRDVIIDFEKFVPWMQHWVGRLIYQTAQESEPLQVEVAPPILRRREKAVFCASAYLLHVEEDGLPSDLGIESIGGAEERAHEMLCVMELRSVVARRAKSKKKRRGIRTVSTWPVSGSIRCKVSL